MEALPTFTTSPTAQGRHPGFQAKGMMPRDCEEKVHFLMTTGTEADSITMPRETLVPVEAAYKAAEEFLHEAALPPSVSWFEL
jgi:Immunity protein Imm1